MEYIIVILVCCILPLSILIKPIYKFIKNKENIKEFFLKNKYEIVLVFILIVGSLARLYNIGIMPNALNADEASSGYEAYSIMKYGIDRAGNSYPVYLYAWGSGQNALYSYFLIPFVQLLGLTIFSTRLPMALIGIMSLYVFYYLLKSIFDNKKMAMAGILFFAICPWHIMKSRWGLESNLFPDLILLACLLLVLGLKKKNNILQVLSFVVIGISSYSYATSYLFLPIFVILLLIYLIIHKEISIKKAIIYLGIVFIISLPLILYVIVNTFDLNQFSICGITIPKLKVNRYEEASTIFSGNILENCIDNLLSTIRLLLVQNDKLYWNSLPNHGLFYFVSIPFLFIGIYVSVKKFRKNKYNQVMNIWMISSIILSMFCIININRINIIMIPCIYYIILGLYNTINKYKMTIPILIIIYTICFVVFENDYWSQDFNKYLTFTSGLEEVSEYCENSDAEEIYCYYSFKEPYIYFLFYDKKDVNEYVESVQYFYENGTFDNVESFGEYRFYLPDEVEEHTIVIVPKGKELDYDLEVKNKINVNQFDIYEY